jgi:hypothetical protein
MNGANAPQLSKTIPNERVPDPAGFQLTNTEVLIEVRWKLKEERGKWEQERSKK